MHEIHRRARGAHHCLLGLKNQVTLGYRIVLEDHTQSHTLTLGSVGQEAQFVTLLVLVPSAKNNRFGNFFSSFMRSRDTIGAPYDV